MVRCQQGLLLRQNIIFSVFFLEAAQKAEMYPMVIQRKVVQEVVFA
jgi:hypothetical protein